MNDKDVTGSILNCCFNVINELGAGFVEAVYKNALYHDLLEKGHKVEIEKPFKISYRDKIIGEYRADIVVNDSVIVELKCCQTICPEHKAQVINYLKVSGLPIGLLVNFGNRKLGFNRLYHPDEKYALSD